MEQNIVMDALYQLKKSVLGSNLIAETGWDSARLSEFFDHPDHIRGMRQMIERGNFNTKDIFSLYEVLIRSLAPRCNDVDLLIQFHAFAVNLSFPGTEPYASDRGLDGVSQLFLRIMRVYCDVEKQSQLSTWQSKYPLVAISPKEEGLLENSAEYQRFKFYFKQDYVYEMMKMNQDIMGYTTLDHICGVHHIAMKVARQLKRAGVKIDLGRVSGAAAGHDVGKYGCKGTEKKRVAYYHYHYTGVWFEKRGITYIRHVAINHSTWDLELEHLPVEALVLIYADFRVKADDTGQMRFYTLRDSFQVILDKLDQVDEAKENRYKRVYKKLEDFENFLLTLDIDVSSDIGGELEEGHVRPRVHPSLLKGKEIISHTKFLSIEHNLKLMHLLRDENSLNRLLETARSLQNSYDLRGYIDIIQEYSMYLTQKQKQIAVNFLYSLLVTPEEDIRKHCAQCMGLLIGHFDEELRKEIPEGAEVARFEMESHDLLEKYIERLLCPDLQIIGKHRHWTSYSLKDVLMGYFESQTNKEKAKYAAAMVVRHFSNYSSDTAKQLYLLHALRALPLSLLDPSDRALVREALQEGLLHREAKLRMATLNALGDIVKMEIEDPDYFEPIIAMLVQSKTAKLPVAEKYGRAIILEKLGRQDRLVYLETMCDVESIDVSTLFLTNLKSATDDITKKFQVKFLVDYARMIDTTSVFYTSMHLCNLLKVSALESVRNTAGESLVELIDLMSVSQCNDIVVELLRALEMESYQFTRYIPNYLGRILLKVQPIELDEIIADFKDKIKRSGPQLGMLIIRTVGEIVKYYGTYGQTYEEDFGVSERRLESLVGILLNGFVSYMPAITQTTMSVLGREIYGSSTMPMSEKKHLIDLSLKKALSLLNLTHEENELVFMSNAGGLKHLYKVIGDYEHQFGVMQMPSHNRVAFFPGSFDPFSISHKQIAKEIRNLGFEVYLAVDEFSWSKRTQPNLVRRDIIKMAVADEVNIYVYPRDISVNLANERDLQKLLDSFLDRQVFMVVGSDVVINASAYKTDGNKLLQSFPHVVFERLIEDASEEASVLDRAFESLDPRSIRLVLPPQYEQVSSTQIRDYIDENRDISELVDPLAQRYIYEKGLYQREPQYKEVMTTKSTVVEILTDLSSDMVEELASIVPLEFGKVYSALKKLKQKESFRVLVLRSVAEKREIIGFACFHWLRSSQMYTEFTSDVILGHLREHAVGRMLVIDGLYANDKGHFKNATQLVLTEALAYCLARDYTYAICHNVFDGVMDYQLQEVLKHQGFIHVAKPPAHDHVYAVNMSSPCTLNLDLKSLIKEPFRSDPEVVSAIDNSRRRLQEAIIRLYPGHLVLSFDRTMIYENLIKKICDENEVPTTPLTPRVVGQNMCVPFGDIIKRWILPNTVTKAIHIEKYFYPTLDDYKIEAYPYYLDIENQMEMLKSFNRPILMVDDILDKGYRIKVIEPALRKHQIEIKKVFVGILSGHGKALMASKEIEVDSAYFIPRLRVWFNEGKLYPFFGGDAVWRGFTPERNMIPSVNLIMPYASPTYIKGSNPEAIYQVSKVAIENAMDIMRVIEERYQVSSDRMLTVARLGEVLAYPRYPDKGRHISYDMNRKVSEYLALDLEQLVRMRKTFTQQIGE